MVHLIANKKKGLLFLLNPVFLIALLLLVLLIFIGPKIAQKLEMIGIADDYLIYDDFLKGYLDEELWEYDQICTYKGCTQYSIYNDLFRTSGGTLTTTKEMLGRHLKTKVTVSYVQMQSPGCYFSPAVYVDVRLNDVSMFYTPKAPYRTSVTYVVEAISSFESPEIYTIRLNGEDYDVVNVSNVNGDGKLDFVAVYERINCPVYANVHYLKSKLPYSCKIYDDEILLFDSFNAESTVNISTLSHEPVKFCLDYPIKARSFDEDGIKTDIRGEILQKLVRGQSATVPENEEWKVYYISKLTPDISLLRRARGG